MKAAVLFEAPGKFLIENVSIDKPGPHEVVVRVAATGLCHSDLHILNGSLRLPASFLPFPAVLGHEGAGVVEAVGSEVTYLRAGDHVVAFSAGFCGKCEWCFSDRPTLCQQNGLQRANDDRPRLRLANGTACAQFVSLGTFGEEMLVHENSLVKIDAGIPLDRAVLVGCAVSTGVGAVIRTAKVPPGANVAIVGCGGIGLNCIQGALIAGANRIVGIDINDGKLAMAKQFGATDVINSSEGDAVEQLLALLPGRGGVDHSFEALGLKQTCEVAYSVLRPGGTATMIGVGEGSFEIPISDASREKRVQGSRMGSMHFRRDLPYLLDLYLAGRLMLDELVTRRISLEEINEGYDAITGGATARSIVVFD
jgi:S-(hydroxymethyl)glutathione dehydrogenase/alcohol dehydrogenase